MAGEAVMLYFARAPTHPPSKDKLCDILYNLGFRLWVESREPLGEADLALPRDEEDPVDLRV